MLILVAPIAICSVGYAEVEAILRDLANRSDSDPMADQGSPHLTQESSSQKRRRHMSHIQAELELYDENELLQHDPLPEPDSKRPKLAEVDSSGLHSSLLPPTSSDTVVLSSNIPNSSHSGPDGASLKYPAHVESIGPENQHPSPSTSDATAFLHTNVDLHLMAEDKSLVEPDVDPEKVSHYMERLITSSGHPFCTHLSSKTFFPSSSSSSLDDSATSVASSSSGVGGVGKDDGVDSGVLPGYVVTRVHASKTASDFSRLLSSLENCQEMLVIGYRTNGDSAKEFSSTRGSKDLPLLVMVPAMNLKEQIQVVALRVDNAMEVFEMELAPQTSNAFALIGGARKSGKHQQDTYNEKHFDLLVNIIKRKIISPTVQLVIYNTQRLLRLLQMFRPKFLFHSFEEPPLDPFVAGFVLDPEMGVDADSERSALSMRSYEFVPMMKAYCATHAMIPTRTKNELASDTFLTRDLALSLWDKLEKKDLVDSFMFEMRITVILAKMEVPGMMVDLKMLQEPKRAIHTKLKELTLLASQVLGHDILLSSPSQVAEAIYTGLEDYIAGEKSKNSALKRTSAGKHQSTKEAALLELKKRMKGDGMTNMRQYKLVEIVLEHRPIHKLLSFLDAVEITAEKSKDPRFRIVYPKWLQCNTGTGRITGASPNMQTQPTTDEIRLLAYDTATNEIGGGGGVGGSSHMILPTMRIGSSLETSASSSSSSPPPNDALLGTIESFKINIRSAYVSRPGYTLVGADYSQIEMRILAQVSNDEQLIHLFKTGMDIHRQVASRVFKVPVEAVSSQQREWCKRIVYGIVYGMGVQALSKSLDISNTRGKEFYDTFMGSFPKVQEWIHTARVDVTQRHMVRTMLKRIREFEPGATTDAGKYKRQGVNTIIQGSAADIVKLAMVGIDTQVEEAEIGAKLLLQIHDELIYEVLDAHIGPFKVIMRRCMEGAAPHFQVPLTVNVETGQSWGLMKP